jgi:hypothetical protein
MKLIGLFDYMFYRIASFYENKFGNEDRWNAISILSIIQSTNILILVSVFCILRKDDIRLSPFVLLLISTLFCFVFNLLRYNKIKKFKDFEILWGIEEEQVRNRKGIFIIAYSLSSIVSLIFIMNFAIK